MIIKELFEVGIKNANVEASLAMNSYQKRNIRSS